MKYVFCAQIERQDDGSFLVTFPDVPEAITEGANRQEALANAADALGLALRGYLALDRPLPEPRITGKGLVPVAVTAGDALKLAVIDAFRAAGISKSELARRLGKTENEARRILDPDHPTKLPALEAALAILGKQILIIVQDAA